MSERHDREIGDRVIDEAARQMTDAQPSADFRARVLARIIEGQNPRSTWRGVWVLAPFAAAAVAIVAIVVARGVQPRDRQPYRSADQTVAAKPGTTVRLSPSVDAPPVKKPDTAYEPGSASRVRLPPPPLRGFGETGSPDRTYAISEVDALAPPPLVAPSLAIATLTIDSIALDELETPARIAIASLATPEGEGP